MSLLPPPPDPIDVAAIESRLAGAGSDRDAGSDRGARASSRRSIGLRAIEIGPDALDALPRLVRDALGDRPGDVVVLTDATPMLRGTSDLKPEVVARLRDALETTVRHVVLGEGRPALHADEAALAEADVATEDAAVVVSVGSGTVTDVAKDASCRAGLPFVVVQTAVSVNAFSDDMAVLLRRGVKRTVPSHWPRALVVDLRVIADAPPEMNRAGFGELTAMFTAPADWYLANAVGADGSYDAEVVDLYRPGGERLLRHAAGVAAGAHAALAELAAQMTLTGIAMGVAGRTAPLSGTEHTISHLLDMAAEVDGRETAFHGAQVGVAAIIVALAWRRVLRDLDPERIAAAAAADGPVPGAADGPALTGSPVELDARRSRVADAFDRLDATGAATAECWSDYRRKVERWEAAPDRRAAFARDWPIHRGAIEALVLEPRSIVEGLRTAGAPTRFSELEPTVPADVARWAVASCHLMRDRFTLADLVDLTGAAGHGWDAAFADELLAEAASLGAGL